MKTEFWKDYRFWLAVVAAVLLIVAVVLYFTYPVFCYAVSGLLIGALAGYIIGYYIAKKQYYLPK